MWSRPRLVKAPAASLHPVEPALVEPVARRFHGGMIDAGASEFGKQAVQGDRIGRGERAIVIAAGRGDAGRADARRGEPGMLPDLAGEGGDRGLAAGAGNRDHHLRLAAEEARRRSAPAPGADRRPRSAARQAAAARRLASSPPRPHRACTASAAKPAPLVLAPASAKNRCPRPDRARIRRQAGDGLLGGLRPLDRQDRRQIRKASSNSDRLEHQRSLSPSPNAWRITGKIPALAHFHG